MREPPWIDYGPGYQSPWTVLHIIDHIWWAHETSEARRRREFDRDEFREELLREEAERRGEALLALA